MEDTYIVVKSTVGTITVTAYVPKLYQDLIEPNYPVPATEVDNALAMPMERRSFYVKKCLLLLRR